MAFQLWHLGISISIMIIALAGARLPISIHARLVVIGYQRHIAHRNIVKRIGSALRHKGVSEGSRIADRFLGNDVDGSTDGRRAKEGRATTTNHLYAVNHISRNLLQAINAVQRRKHRTRIDQDLRIVAIKTINAHLGEATVLAVVFGAHTRLKVEPLCQTSALCDVKAAGNSRWRSFMLGSLSGVVEPIGAVAVIALATLLTPALPYLLAFAAGAMFYVVVEELIPEASSGQHSNLSTIGFAIGFVLMMVLDVVMG